MVKLSAKLEHCTTLHYSALVSATYSICTTLHLCTVGECNLPFRVAPPTGMLRKKDLCTNFRKSVQGFGAISTLH